MGCPKCRCLLSARSELPGRLLCANCGTLLPLAAGREGKPATSLAQGIQSSLILLVMAGVAVSMALAGANTPGVNGPEREQASQQK